MFINYKQIQPPNLSNDQIHDLEIRLNRHFTAYEIDVINNSTSFRKADQFTKALSRGSQNEFHNLNEGESVE